MKFAARNCLNGTVSGRWVFMRGRGASNEVVAFSGSDDAPVPMPDSLDVIAGLDTESSTDIPLNGDISGVINRTRVGMEGPLTVAENHAIITKRLGAFAIARQREAGGFRPSGRYNLSAPSEWWLIPDKAAREGLNIPKWWGAIFSSKGPILGALNASVDDVIRINRESDLIDSQITYHFLDANLKKTIKRVSGGRKDGVSLFALEKLEAGLEQYRPEAFSDFEDFDSDLQKRTEAEETWKKITRWIFIWTNRNPQRWQANVLHKQMEKGFKQIEANIKSARESQSRKVSNISARIDRTLNEWADNGNTRNLELFWLMITDILQNPGEFLNGKEKVIQGIEWRKLFKPGRGKNGAVNFLDTLIMYREDILDLLAIQTTYHINKDISANIIARDKHQKETYGTALLSEARKELYSVEVEQIPDIPEGPAGTDLVVEKLVQSLQAHPLNIDVESKIFNRGDDNLDISIHLSPMERFSWILKYLLETPALLNSKDPTTSLSIEALAYLKGFLKKLEDKALARLESRTITEATTPFARAQLLMIADEIVKFASDIINIDIPDLASSVSSRDQSVVDSLLNKLESLPTNIQILKSRLGDPSNPNAPINHITETERETLSEVITSLEALGEQLSNASAPIQEARKEFGKLLAIPDDEYIEEKDELVNEGFATAREVVSKTGGSLKVEGGGGFFAAGSGATAAGTAESSGEGGSGSGLETSLTTFMRNIQDVYNDVNKWKSQIGAREGFSFPMANDVRPAVNPVLEALSAAIKIRKNELGADALIVDNPTRMTLDESFSLELALETNASMKRFAEAMLQNFQNQQWERLEGKPAGFPLDKITYAMTNNQTDTNVVNAILNPQPELTEIRLIPTPKSEPNGDEVLFAEANDTNGRKWWVKIVSPRLTSGRNKSNIFLYKRAGDLKSQMSPSQIQPISGVIMNVSVKNPTIQDNSLYDPLWGNPPKKTMADWFGIPR